MKCLAHHIPLARVPACICTHGVDQKTQNSLTHDAVQAHWPDRFMPGRHRLAALTRALTPPSPAWKIPCASDAHWAARPSTNGCKQTDAPETATVDALPSYSPNAPNAPNSLDTGGAQ